jgi:exodeoxyribonuclease VII large subunit
VRDAVHRLDETHERLHRSALRRIAIGRQRLEALAGRLDSLSPLNVLGRGYSLTRNAKDGHLIKNVDQVQAGDHIVTQLHHGRIVSRVEETAT